MLAWELEQRFSTRNPLPDLAFDDHRRRRWWSKRLNQHSIGVFGKKCLLSVCPDEVRGATKHRVITNCDPDVYGRYWSCDAGPPKGCYNEAVRYKSSDRIHNQSRTPDAWHLCHDVARWIIYLHEIRMGLSVYVRMDDRSDTPRSQSLTQGIGQPHILHTLPGRSGHQHYWKSVQRTAFIGRGSHNPLTQSVRRQQRWYPTKGIRALQVKPKARCLQKRKSLP